MHNEINSRIEIREIVHDSPDYQKEVSLRYRVLRVPLGLTFSDEELAAEWNEIHLGAFIEEKLAGCLVLRPIGNSAIQMRQVAVEPELQHSGIGKALVHFAENYSLTKGYSEIVLHARANVIPFYEKLGYKKEGEQYIEVTIPHQTMRKIL